MTIADRIKQKRLELGLTQEELAVKMGYSDKTSVSKIESSGDDISLKKINKIAKALGVDEAYLLGYYDESYQELNLPGPMPERLKNLVKQYVEVNNRSFFIESLTDFELDLIDLYRSASEDTQKAVCAILGIKKEGD